jgi:outer membrane immunogenic protein
MKFKTKLLVAAGAMVLAGAASAQAHNWNGYYVGFNVGGQRGTADMSSTFSDGGEGWFYSGDKDAIAAASTGSARRTQFHGGVAWGYNSVSGNQLLGYELDLSFNDLRYDRAALNVPYCGECPGFSVQQRVRSHNLLTARGRWGLLTGTGLVYVTGGAAWTKLSITSNFSGNWDGEAASASTSKMKMGWAAGVGYEQPMSNGWTLKAEYLHAKFGDITATGALNYDSGTIMTARTDLKLDIVRVGFNKKF